MARWSFDKTQLSKAHDSASGIDDLISGDHKVVPGVTGDALRMDGESTVIRRAAAGAPKPEQGLSVEAFVAVNAYPWNWVPIVDQARNQEAGYFFGIDASGRLGLQVCVQGKWQSLSSTDPVPLRRWTQVAGAFDPAKGLTLYLDGKIAGELAVHGALTLAPGEDLLIRGGVRQPLVPTHAIHPKYPVWYSFDGILNDIRVYGAALPATEIQGQFVAAPPSAEPPIPPPVLPRWRSGDRCLRRVLHDASLRRVVGRFTARQPGIRRGRPFRPVAHPPRFLAGNVVRRRLGDREQQMVHR